MLQDVVDSLEAASSAVSLGGDEIRATVASLRGLLESTSIDQAIIDRIEVAESEALGVLSVEIDSAISAVEHVVVVERRRIESAINGDTDAATGGGADSGGWGVPPPLSSGGGSGGGAGPGGPTSADGDPNPEENDSGAGSTEMIDWVSPQASVPPDESARKPGHTMTREESENTPQKDREHPETQDSWRRVLDFLDLYPTQKVADQVREWLGDPQVGADGLIRPTTYEGGHMVERHEGQVTFRMLLARLLWKRSPSGEPKDSVVATATSFTSPEAMLIPLLALAEKTWITTASTADGKVKPSGNAVIDAMDKSKKGKSVVLLDPSRCDFPDGAIAAVKGARAEHRGIRMDFARLRNMRASAKADIARKYSDAVVEAREVTQSELQRGSIRLVFKKDDGGTWRVLTGFPDPDNRPEVR